MLGFGILNFLKSISVPILYYGGIGTMVVSIFKKPEWGFFLLVALVPQPNIYYKLYEFPFGKDFMDCLYFSVLAGIFIKKGGLTVTKNSIIIIIFIIVSYISIWISSFNFSLPLPLTTENPVVKPWKNYAMMLFMYLLGLNVIKEEEKDHKIVLLIMSLSVLFISFRSFQAYSGGETFSYGSRYEGPFWRVLLGANHFGSFIAQYWALFLGLLFYDKDIKRRIIYLVTILLCLHPLFFSYSRGAYVAAFSALVFYGIVKKRILLVGILIGYLSWQDLLPPSVVDRILMTTGSSGELEHSAAVRLDLWNAAIGFFLQNPIFGIGMGGFVLAVPEELIYKDTHNFYLKMLSEQGVIGIGLLIIILYGALKSGFELTQIGRSEFQKGLGFGFLGCVIACIVNNIFGDRWSYPTLGGYLWLAWGMVDRSILLSERVDEAVVKIENNNISKKRGNLPERINKNE
jgi:putative inorganic carbon (HCO3(-)) transporter